MEETQWDGGLGGLALEDGGWGVQIGCRLGLPFWDEQSRGTFAGAHHRPQGLPVLAGAVASTSTAVPLVCPSRQMVSRRCEYCTLP